MIVTKAEFGQMLFIGRAGENRARAFCFDLHSWVEAFGSGNVQILLTRPGEDIPYPAVLEKTAVNEKDPVVKWIVTAGDVAIKGRGRAEIQFSVGSAVVKSETITTISRESLGSEITEPPEAYPTWAEEVLEAADRVEADFTSKINTACTTAVNTAVTKAEQKNRVFYGTCDSYYEYRDVYLTADSRKRWSRLQDGDVLICRMNSSVPDDNGVELDIYLNTGWSGYKTACANWNKYTGAHYPIRHYHWRSGSVVIFVYFADLDVWIAPTIQPAEGKYYGITRIENSVTSTETVVAASAAAVKKAYDLAKKAYDLVSQLTE